MSNQWKKGQTGNPKNKRNRGLTKARRMTRAEVLDAFSKFMHLTKPELDQYIKDPSTPAMELMLANIVRLGIAKGDTVRLGFMLDRLIGKVSDRVTHEVKPYVIENLDGAPLELGAAPVSETPADG